MKSLKVLKLTKMVTMTTKELPKTATPYPRHYEWKLSNHIIKPCLFIFQFYLVLVTFPFHFTHTSYLLFLDYADFFFVCSCLTP